ncbi:MAG: segregation/condensation protein A [Clostridia bacterium]|nr:segregation/condensation protein A [Clostridia bacterium]
MENEANTVEENIEFEENIEDSQNEENADSEINKLQTENTLDEYEIQDNISNEENIEPEREKTEEELRVEQNKLQYGFSANFDLSRLDKKSREILEETDETDYNFKLKDFEGPLDLLVHLIKITKINIRDIFISNITEQYLKLMEDIDSIDVEKASEFINMATTLLEIKSKHLLPKDPVYEGEEDTSEEDFFRMVEEYKLIKDEMEKLAEAEEVDRFYKLPDSTVGEFRYELPENLSVDALIKSFSNLLQKMAIKEVAVQEKKIQKDRFTVAQKIAQIKDTLIDKKEFKFTELFEDEDNYSKSEIINTFLALLELLKRQYIYVKQDSLFDEIEIIRNDDIQERLTEEDIGSEYDGEN